MVVDSLLLWLFAAAPSDGPEPLERALRVLGESEAQKERLEACAFKADPKDPSPAERLVIAFEPRERHERRMQGTVDVDAASFELRAMRASPSAYPAFLHELSLTLRFAQTPCGAQPVRIQSHGKGGFLFVHKRFRSGTELGAYQLRGPLKE